MIPVPNWKNQKKSLIFHNHTSSRKPKEILANCSAVHLWKTLSVWDMTVKQISRSWKSLKKDWTVVIYHKQVMSSYASLLV